MRALYALLLYCYPGTFRRRYGEELLRLFDAERRDPQYRGVRGQLRFWRYLTSDLLASAARQRVLRLAHLTDVHVQPELRAPEGMTACLRHIHAANDRPDLILLANAPVADDPAAAFPWESVRHYERDLVADPRFAAEYAFVRIPLGDRKWLLAFVRRRAT